MMKRTRIASIIIVCLIAALFLCWRFLRAEGSIVEIENTGSDDVVGLVVQLADKTYIVGNLAPKTTKQLFVYPSHDSHVEISFVGPHGQRRTLDGGGYFTPGIKTHLYIKLESSGASETLIQ
jgi:hypothetical protein